MDTRRFRRGVDLLLVSRPRSCVNRWLLRNLQTIQAKSRPDVRLERTRGSGIFVYT